MKDSVFRNEDLRVVHNGVDTAQFRPASAQDAAQARAALLPAAMQRRLVIGSNAGTASYKNWLDMVTAVSLLPDYLRDQVVIMIAGKQPDDEQRQRVTDLGMADQVVFTGLLEDVGPFLAALDVGFVLSSRLETISFACREMMASGKPVIVSKIGGLTENVTDGRNGWVVPPGSVSSVVKVVSEILKNRDAVAQMGIDARKTAQREFSLAQFVGRTEEVYLERRLGTGGHLRLTS